jgi:hypothetical protein
MSRARDLLALLLLLSAPVVANAQGTPAAAPSPATVENGATVKLEYTLKDDAGTVLDSNKGQEPLSFTQGGQQLMPGLEKQLIGMHVGEEKKVVLKPEDAYGRNDPAAQAEVPKNALPPEALNVGTRLMARNQAGETRPVTVKEPSPGGQDAGVRGQGARRRTTEGVRGAQRASHIRRRAKGRGTAEARRAEDQLAACRARNPSAAPLSLSPLSPTLRRVGATRDDRSGGDAPRRVRPRIEASASGPRPRRDQTPGLHHLRRVPASPDPPL